MGWDGEQGSSGVSGGQMRKAVREMERGERY